MPKTLSQSPNHFLKYLKLILHQDRARVTQYHFKALEQVGSFRIKRQVID